MSVMSELLSKLDMGCTAHASFYDIIEAAESAGGAYGCPHRSGPTS